MAYTVIPTKPDGDGKKLTLSNWNTHIKANIDYLKSLLMGTEADKIPAAALAAEAWTDITLTLNQGGTVAATLVTGRYQKFGRLAVVRLQLNASAAGAGGATISVYGFPAGIIPANQSYGIPLGTFVYEGYGTAKYVGSAISNAGGGIYCQCNGIYTLLGTAGPTIANGDIMQMVLAYETAT